MDCARSENKGKSEEYNNVVKEKRYGNDVVMWISVVINRLWQLNQSSVMCTS